MIAVPSKEHESYSFKILPLSEEDGGGLLIYFPDLKGCMSDGETIEEAITNGYDAVQGWIDVRRGLGYKIPKPSLKAKNKEHAHEVEFPDGSKACVDTIPGMSDSDEEKTRKVDEAMKEWRGF